MEVWDKPVGGAEMLVFHYSLVVESLLYLITVVCKSIPT